MIIEESTEILMKTETGYKVSGYLNLIDIEL